MTQSTTAVPVSCPPAWAHGVGALALAPVQEVPESVVAIADRLLLLDTTNRYALAYDERRLEVLADLFADEVVFAFSVSGGGYQEYAGRGEVIEWLHGIMLGQTDQRRHVCGNTIIDDLGSDQATVTCYFSLFASDVDTHLVTTGFYQFRLRKVDRKWRIVHIYDGLDRPF